MPKPAPRGNQYAKGRAPAAPTRPVTQGLISMLNEVATELVRDRKGEVVLDGHGRPKVRQLQFSKMRQLIEKLYALALDGDRGAIEFIINRVEGYAPQALSVFDGRAGAAPAGPLAPEYQPKALSEATDAELAALAAQAMPLAGRGLGELSQGQLAEMPAEGEA